VTSDGERCGPQPGKTAGRLPHETPRLQVPARGREPAPPCPVSPRDRRAVTGCVRPATRVAADRTPRETRASPPRQSGPAALGCRGPSQPSLTSHGIRVSWLLKCCARTGRVSTTMDGPDVTIALRQGRLTAASGQSSARSTRTTRSSEAASSSRLKRLQRCPTWRTATLYSTDPLVAASRFLSASARPRRAAIRVLGPLRVGMTHRVHPGVKRAAVRRLSAQDGWPPVGTVTAHHPDQGDEQSDGAQVSHRQKPRRLTRALRQGEPSAHANGRTVCGVTGRGGQKSTAADSAMTLPA